MVRSGGPPAMETTLYEEHSYPGAPGMKRSLTLDLNSGPRASKRSRFALGGNAPVLSSPDIQLFKLATPEVEKWILSQNPLATPTPSAQQILFQPNPTEAQLNYARGFEDALNELHHSDSSQGPFSISDQPTYANLERLPPGQQFPNGAPFGAVVKDEPQTVPSVGSSPPVSPIDMESQEKIKLERKRQRNRLAASKCRRRKLERISRLEDKVKALKNENGELGSIVNKLKEHVYMLKEQVMEHAHSGCQITLAF